MNTLTPKDIRDLLAEFCPQPGYVLKLSRAQFEELVDTAIGIDISIDNSSNGKRFKWLLLTGCTEDEQVTALLAALRAV